VRDDVIRWLLRQCRKAVVRAQVNDDFVAARDVLQRLWEIEARGASFVMTETGFNITPEGILTHRDRAFLLEHLDEVKRILKHGADDTHLHVA